MKEQIIQIFKDYYGEENINVEERILENEENLLIILVKLDDFIITNDAGLEHTIKGMWLKFKIHVTEGYRILHLRGTRTKQTEGEFTAKYFHSHMRSGSVMYDGGRFELFCTGSGEFGQLYEYLTRNNIVSLDKLSYFLLMLTHFLSYENMNDAYVHIRNTLALKPVGEQRSYYSRVNEVIDASDFTTAQFNTDYTLKNNLHNHSLIVPHVLDQDKAVLRNGQFYVRNRSLDSTNVSNISTQPAFIFKGEEIYSQIVEDEKDVDISKLPQYVVPSLFKIISNNVKNSITKKLLESQYSEEISRGESEYNNFRRMSRSDKVFMLKYK